MHGIEADHEYKNFTCSECLVSFFNRKSIIQHYSDVHSEVVFCEEKVTFNSWDDFCNWKEDIEKETVSSFVKECGVKSSKFGKLHYFTCHRSGKPVLCGSGKRAMKISGSNKTGYFCPAQIHATVCDDIVQVDYCSTHFGHSNEAGRLNLNKKEKDTIAGQLLQGIPMKNVLSDISESFSPSKRLSLTRRKDLHNIAAPYAINSKEILHQPSFDMWVNKMSEDNSILLYKPQGELSSSHPELVT